jgi:hypothetical protein
LRRYDHNQRHRRLHVWERHIEPDQRNNCAIRLASELRLLGLALRNAKKNYTNGTTGAISIYPKKNLPAWFDSPINIASDIATVVTMLCSRLDCPFANDVASSVVPSKTTPPRVSDR